MIRFAEEKDIPAIMKYIDEYWRKGHIMGRDRGLFEFQHKWGSEISFVLSEKDDEITGILGFIPYGSKNRDVTLAIWKTNKTEDTMQGINILSYLREHGDVRFLSVAGINPRTIPIYKFLGLKTGKMKQWYRLRNVSEYKISKVVDDEIPTYDTNVKIETEKIVKFEDAENKFGIKDCLLREHQLIKSKEYLKRRYFEHPSFDYLKYGIQTDSQKLFIVLRVQECNGSSMLRVIDCVGDQCLFKYFSNEIDNILEENECEYADCYETGISDDVLIGGGWKSVVESGNIMPDYFAPFEQRNIDIYYASEIEDVILLKGDGDMDRPN